jgi:hypothetical protein
MEGSHNELHQQKGLRKAFTEVVIGLVSLSIDALDGHIQNSLDIICFEFLIGEIEKVYKQFVKRRDSEVVQFLDFF